MIRNVKNKTIIIITRVHFMKFYHEIYMIATIPPVVGRQWVLDSFLLET